MTTALEETQTVYRMSDDLLDRTPPSAVRFAAPDDAEREDLVLRKLGAKSWGRLHQFKYYYGPNWGEDGGKPLSPRAVELFYRFLADLTLPEGCKPSIFLTDAGSLELCWEDRQGKAVQVEFTQDGAEYFVESQGIEDRGSNGDLAEIARLLSRV